MDPEPAVAGADGCFWVSVWWSTGQTIQSFSALLYPVTFDACPDAVDLADFHTLTAVVQPRSRRMRAPSDTRFSFPPRSDPHGPGPDPQSSILTAIGSRVIQKREYVKRGTNIIPGNKFI